MAANKTLAEMRVMTREYADQETDATTDTLVASAELDRRINEQLKRLYDMLILARGQEYYHEETSYPAVVGQNNYDLPCRFYRLIGFSVQSGNWHHPMSTWEWQELPYLRSRQTNGGTANIHEYRYRVQRDRIAIYPSPTHALHTFLLDYVPVMDELVADGDSFDGVNGWERWACISAAIDMATKEENYELVQALTAHRAVIESHIQRLAGERDASRPPRIQDVRRDNGTDFGLGTMFYEGWFV